MGNSFSLFVTALDVIEENLCREMTQEDIAAACYCSLSTLQKTWKFCTHMSLKDYITKRRLTLAGRDMLENDISVLDAAMKYGYNSHEVFTRAFTKIWGMPPSAFKKQWKGSCVIYPPLNPEYLEDEHMRNVKKYDVSEFYDYLVAQAGTYVLCFDVVNLMAVNNELGRHAGDRSIIESMRRMNEAADENMLCLRMGGDEFIMMTETSDPVKAKQTADKVLAHNGETTPYNGGEVAVSLRCGVLVINEKLKYSAFCEDFEMVLDKARETGKIEFL